MHLAARVVALCLVCLILVSCEESQLQPPPPDVPPGTGAPAVVDVVPDAGATEVQPTSVLQVTFSEGIDPSTVTSSSFVVTRAATLAAGASLPMIRPSAGVSPGVRADLAGFAPADSHEVAGTVTATDSLALFTPTSPFEPNTIYSARITTAVRDRAGNRMAADYVWSFTTGPPADTTAPTVAAVSPANGADLVVVSTTVRATFSELMDPASVDGASFRLSGPGGSVSGTVDLAGAAATFAPSAPLEPNTLYTARVTTAIRDLAGNRLASDHEWTFTTAPPPDLTRPTVVSVAPLSSEEDVEVGTTIRATFSEEVAPASIHAGTFLVSGTAPVTGTVTLADFTATFTPSSPLAPNTTYTARVTDAIEDLAGNRLASDYVWTFTTAAPPDQVPPTVAAISPQNGATGITTGTAVTATFSEAPAPASLTTTTFRLTGSGVGAVTGAVTLTDKTATFTPASTLVPNTVYTARLTTGIMDPAGNHLAADFVWSFTTAPTPDQTPPTVVDVLPAPSATNVDHGTVVQATFSEPVSPASVNGTTFRLTRGGTSVSGTVSLTGQVATFTPSAPLAPSATYTARVTTGVWDLALNNMASDMVWTFTTAPPPDLTRPTVVSTDPLSGDTDVPADAVIRATFSEIVAGSTVTTSTFRLTGGVGTVSGTVSVSGTTATFTPAGPLEASTTYTARLTAGIEDLAGNHLATDYVWTFSTRAPPDVTPPSVISVLPFSGATGVAPTATVRATFSEPMEPASVSTSTFRLNAGATPIAGTVTFSGETAILTPSTSLAYQTTYTARVTTGVEDLGGNNLGSEFVWTFTTEPAPDLTRPTVDVTAPANGATGVDPATLVRATFSEPVSSTSVNTATFRLSGGAGSVTGTVSLAGQTATFTPSTPLAYATTFTARVTTGVEDLAGNNLAADHVWTFTTGAAPDVTPPTVTALSPTNGAAGVDPGANVTATFSEPMNATTVNGTTFLLSSTAGSVAGAVTMSGNTATFNPSAALAYSTTYTARVTTGVRDLAGNSMASDRVWTFTTGAAPDVTPPTVTSVTPLASATGVDPNVNVTATFSEPVDAASVTGTTFRLTVGTSTLAATVSLSGNTATLNPSSPLAYSTTYTARVTTGVQDLAGNNLASDRVWTFTTGSAPDVTPPTVTTTVPANGATAVDVDGNVTATFSEAMAPASVSGTTFLLSSTAGSTAGAVTLTGNTAT
ncbi:MAG TPA: Ig-like domain-containing protein, partial [Candidatus Eisenbacteria bacterium]|nr:Ig-like domain-containing protein [Candidatus Eisenbacteria bacterium]